MKKLMAITLIFVFALTFAVGVMVTPSQAKNPIPCTYRCINHDWYLCCIYPAPVGEVCIFYAIGC